MCVCVRVCVLYTICWNCHYLLIVVLLEMQPHSSRWLSTIRHKDTHANSFVLCFLLHDSPVCLLGPTLHSSMRLKWKVQKFISNSRSIHIHLCWGQQGCPALCLALFAPGIQQDSCSVLHKSVHKFMSVCLTCNKQSHCLLSLPLRTSASVVQTLATWW